ncbi:translocation/assembly module TamB domain-containing protein [Acidomonas methanolica]|nr:translocation/assembly module TamB domain-containing protein [Acidomonas methanolica]
MIHDPTGGPTGGPIGGTTGGKRPRRWRRRLIWLAALLIGVPVTLLAIAVAVLLIGANTGAGRRLIERETASVTGGMVALEGLRGRFPHNFRLDRIAVRDAKGVWLELDGLHLMWSPLALFGRNLSVHSLSADRLAIMRLPVSSSAPTASSPSGGSSPLHLRVIVDSLHVGRIEVAAPVAGVPAVFGLDGYLLLRDLATLLDGPALAALPVAEIGVVLQRLDAPGSLKLYTATPKGAIDLHLAVSDGAGGFISSLTHLDALQPATFRLVLHGPLRATALDFGADAGPVQASVAGRVDLLGQSGVLAVHAHAPAMTPVPGVTWDGLDFDADLHGSMKAPIGTGNLSIRSLSANGAGVGEVRARFDGTEGASARDALVHLHAIAEGIRLPGSAPTVLAAAPLELDLRLRPGLPTLPVTLDVTHKLLHLAGQAALKPAPSGTMTLDLPDLAPLAAVGGVALKGHAGFRAAFALPDQQAGAASLKLTGTLGVTGGMPAIVGLIGPSGTLALDVASRVLRPGAKDSAREVALHSLSVSGQSLTLTGQGAAELGTKTTLRTDLALALSDLSKLSPSLRGDATLNLHAEGPLDDLAATAHLQSDFGAHDVPKGPLTLDAAFTHLPGHAEGTVKASGTLDRAPLALDAAVSRGADGVLHLGLNSLSWNSAVGHGTLVLPPGAKVPLGTLDLEVKRLADFNALLGQRIGGHLKLAETTTAASASTPPVVHLTLDGAFDSAQARVGGLALSGSVADPAGTPSLDLKIALAQLAAKGVSARAEARLEGPLSALDIAVQARAATLMGGPAAFDTALRLDLPGRKLALSRLNADVKGEKLRLLAGAAVSFGDRMGVDRLRLTLTPPRGAAASLDLGGTVKPALDVTARFQNVTPALARPFAPSLNAAGTLEGQARLTGSTTRPEGSITLKGRELRMTQGVASSLPAATIDAQAQLHGGSARLDTTVKAGDEIALALRGTAPVSAQGALDLRATGHVDLSIADAVLGAQGISTSGQVVLDLGIGGTASAPRATGSISLRHATINDYAQGARLYDINGTIQAQGDSFAFEDFVAHAGQGTIGVGGTVGAFRPGLPVDLRVTAQNAQPVASDLLTAKLNAALRIHGQAMTRIDVDGKVTIPTATINIPNSLPTSVPQLDVIRPGQKAPTLEETAPQRVIGLDLTVISPGEFFVRGHGLDAVMSGKLHIGGTASEPAIDGGFDLRRGNFNLAGVNLNFTQGRVAFNGSGVSHKLDPTLNFRADRNVEGTLASLLVTGYASAPKIDFHSNPEEPRDQVLAMLLFGTTTAKLSTTQLAELAAAVAQLSGGSSFDPMGKLRSALGLDRLAVGGGSGVNNGGASVEAGKYVMKGVYVGAKQATSGSGTQAQVQVDLTRHLKLNTTVGTGGQVTGFTTPENDPGSSVGLGWGINY